MRAVYAMDSSAALTFRQKLLQRHFMTYEPAKSASDPGQPSLYPLTDLGLIEVTGTEAESFLNAQLSRNVDSGKPLRAPLSAWHDARGRVLALVRTLWTGECWLILAKGADVDALIRRLRMFVLRADVQLRNGSSGWRAGAAHGNIEAWLARRSLTLGTQPGDVAVAGGAFIIRVGSRLAYLVAAGDTLADFESDLPTDQRESGAVEEIRLGLVDLTPKLAGRYTAHMLNLDRLGAVAFDKGCYPGQEVIARTQNLGSAKRRVFRFSAALTRVPAVGSALLDGGGRRVGEVVRAAAGANGRVELLAVVHVNAAADGPVFDAGGSIPLVREPLPEVSIP